MKSSRRAAPAQRRTARSRCARARCQCDLLARMHSASTWTVRTQSWIAGRRTWSWTSVVKPRLSARVSLIESARGTNTAGSQRVPSVRSAASLAFIRPRFRSRGQRRAGRGPPVPGSRMQGRGEFRARVRGPSSGPKFRASQATMAQARARSAKFRRKACSRDGI